MKHILKNYTIQDRDKGKLIFQKFQMIHKESKEIRDMQIQQYIKGDLNNFIKELEKKAQQEFEDKYKQDYNLI